MINAQQIFEQILSTNLINFIIVISTLVLIFKKANLGALIEKMALEVQKSVEKSALDTQDAIKEYKETKKSSKDTQKLQDEIIENAKTNACNIKEKIDSQTLIKEKEILETLEKIKSSQADKIKLNTINSIYQGCVNLAIAETKNLLDEEKHNRIIDFSIEELDKLERGLL